MNSPTFMGVDYDEWKPETYRGVFIQQGEGEKILYHTGDFNRDREKALNENSVDFVLSSLHNYESDYAKTL